MLTSLHTLAALDANHRLCAGALGNDLQSAQVRMKFLVKCFGAGTDTFQTCHAFYIFLNSQLFHNGGFSFLIIFYETIILHSPQNSNIKIGIAEPIPSYFSSVIF
jgi:hypothetical protein